jgi:hypothetical protein
MARTRKMSVRDALTAVVNYTDLAIREQSDSFQFSIITVAFELLHLLYGS